MNLIQDRIHPGLYWPLTEERSFWPVPYNRAGLMTPDSFSSHFESCMMLKTPSD